MQDDGAPSVLRRLLRDAGASVRGPVTPTRAVRLAMARAATQSIGLPLTVAEVSDRLLPPDEMVAELSEALLLLGLVRGDAVVGLAAIDPELRNACVEVQTIGRVNSASPPERRTSAADVALVSPAVSAFLSDLARVALDTTLEGWANHTQVGARLQDGRAALIALGEAHLRVMRLTVAMADGARQGELTVALPSLNSQPVTKAPVRPSSDTFAAALRASVMSAPSELRAVTGPMSLPLREVERMHVGQVIPLPGITVAAIKLIAPDGRSIARAKLGQMAGLRAVRLEHAPAPRMRDALIRPEHNLNDAVAAAMDASGAVSGGMAPLGVGFDPDPTTALPVSDALGGIEEHPSDQTEDAAGNQSGQSADPARGSAAKSQPEPESS